MRALVVGGAGFLGSHVVDRLLAEGHTVDVVDDLSTGSLANLGPARAAHVGSLKFHNLDVRVPELADLLARLQPDVAVHLAVPTTGAGPDLLSRALGGTANLLDALVGLGRRCEGRRPPQGGGRPRRRRLLRTGAAPRAPGQGGHAGAATLHGHHRPPCRGRPVGAVPGPARGRVHRARPGERLRDQAATGRRGGGGVRRGPPSRSASRDPRQRSPDPRLRGRRRRRRRRGAGHHPRHRSRRERRHRRADLGQRPARAGGGHARRHRRSRSGARPGDVDRFALSPGAGPHPPGLGAVDGRDHGRG